MYAIQVMITDKCGNRPVKTFIYGAYRTLDRATDVKLVLAELAEFALDAPGSVDVAIEVFPLVKNGLLDAIRDLVPSGDQPRS